MTKNTKQGELLSAWGEKEKDNINVFLKNPLKLVVNELEKVIGIELPLAKDELDPATRLTRLVDIIRFIKEKYLLMPKRCNGIIMARENQEGKTDSLT